MTVSSGMASQNKQLIIRKKRRYPQKYERSHLGPFTSTSGAGDTKRDTDFKVNTDEEEDWRNLNYIEM